jgi:hypothetical protein
LFWSFHSIVDLLSSEDEVLNVLALGWEEEEAGEAGFLCSSLRFFFSLPRSFPFLSPFSLLFFFLFLSLSFSFSLSSPF